MAAVEVVEIEDDSGSMDGGDDGVVTLAMIQEEEKIARENERRDAAEKKKAPAAVAPQKKMLDELLNKAKMYSGFLKDCMTEASEAVVQEPKSKKGRGPKQTKAQKGARGAALLAAVQQETEEKEELQRRKTMQQPELLTGVELRDYQLAGVQWIISLYENGLNGILGDEMGLGKTLQSIGFLCHIISKGVAGPFLVVAPMSTLSNWVNEIQRGAPTVEALLYHGSIAEREEKRQILKKAVKTNRMPIVVTSFEIAMNDRKHLQPMAWKYLIVDEGHRLKNRNCKLLRELKQLRAENRLLLTGTPLQNNLVELWSLLNFLMPNIFNDADTFLRWFEFADAIHEKDAAETILQEVQDKDIVSTLHSILKPFLLRRMKGDVSLNLPSKTEYILHATMSQQQRDLTTVILNKELKTWISDQDRMHGMSETNVTRNLNSSMVQLRKCCNHPYLFTPKVDACGEFLCDEDLVLSCGKLRLLDRMLPVLKANGHRVLIFCQMTRMLDIVADYLEMRGMLYCRLDGVTKQVDRVDAIRTFNTDPEHFCFLLSTRAGGLGINLATADTVIIYDSDWNPQVDLQAQDRAHRIGQTKPVCVFRLVTGSSIESVVFERATNKRKLEQLVIHKGKFVGDHNDTNVTLEELNNLLRSANSLAEDVSAAGDLIGDEELHKLLTVRDVPHGESGVGWRKNVTTSESWL